MRIIAGSCKGRQLQAPSGSATRPTADRVRQALFDMLLHAPWAGSDVLRSARVLDAFAGTGGLGLEALSRGADSATFFETDRAALACLRSNIAACHMNERAVVYPRDVLKPPQAREPATLIFLDPPYGKGLPALALEALRRTGWIAPGALIVTETGREEEQPVAEAEILAERTHGAARLWVWREDSV